MTFEYNITNFNDFLNDFKEYQNIVEQKLIEDSIEKFPKYDYDDIDELEWNKRNSEIGEFRKQIAFYSNSFRSSLLVQLFSVFEHELIKICDNYHIEKNTVFKLKDLKGSSDIDKAKIFLQKSGNVNFLNLAEEWKYINTIRKLRNKVIHHQSTLSIFDNEWKELSSFIYENNDKIGFDNYIDVTDKDRLINYYGIDGKLEFHIKNENLTLEFIRIIKMFLIKLLEQLNKS